ncbi:unnamed protein product [Rotaria socialis]|uniref:Uncharacterized protein n=1 Tax=Rotaria socialis TaxID=392032 RepID=A0A817PV96_9BILA|nr:unnamed protein product [Rotaria socialis]CAF3235561.1 unnamed protein product [Rotaria socialis]CAF3327748.1 unnamed protein product [Rotaria socialis]CAF3406591.1 unnamed protein product [Rotaria socialis]CAF3784802.1 unnamed protein product [Rotaria socialis]
MNLFCQRLIKYLSIWFVFICIVRCSRQNAEEHRANAKTDSHDQTLIVARSQRLKEMLTRRSFYDPSFDDTWSKYLEKKRNLFDPAYGDWANRFKK